MKKNRDHSEPIVRSLLGRGLLALGLLASASGFAVDTRIDEAATRTASERVAAHEAQLAVERASLPDAFDAAYQLYPNLPRGSLEAIAFVQSRWVNQQADPKAERHLHLPFAHGVMGLYDGHGFEDQVGTAAKLLGVSAKQIRLDPAMNILAGAALLNEATGGRDIKSMEEMAPVLESYAGFVPAKDRAVQRFARQNFAYDVLLTLDRGVDDNGIRVPEIAIRWEETFDVETLSLLQAPFVRLDISRDRIELPDYAIDPRTETLVPDSAETRDAQNAVRSTDYGPALWVTSPYHGTRSASISAVTIHTMQGSYAGSISWFQSNPFSVSAHYLIRSSDGQVTQMVREYRRAHHVGVHNSATLGIEHEGFVESGSSWYTTSMYNASSALTRHFCSRYGISCANAYSGPAHSGVVVLSTSIPIKGHQHFSSQTHVDPGIFWDWSRYHSLLNGGSGGGGGGSTTILDSFEGSEGHFNTSPTYSGSTVGISTSSTANRVCTIARNGSCSEQIKLVDNSSTSSNWSVRFLSGSGRPGSNTSLTRSGGRVGFWIYSGGSNISVGLGVDDSDGTERSDAKAIPANSWTFVEWRLDNSADWNPWFGGNGAISASSVTLDAIWLYHPQTTWDVFVYIDDVQYNN